MERGMDKEGDGWIKRVKRMNREGNGWMERSARERERWVDGEGEMD